METRSLFGREPKNKKLKIKDSMKTWLYLIFSNMCLVVDCRYDSSVQFCWFWGQPKTKPNLWFYKEEIQTNVQ